VSGGDRLCSFMHSRANPWTSRRPAQFRSIDLPILVHRFAFGVFALLYLVSGIGCARNFVLCICVDGGIVLEAQYASVSSPAHGASRTMIASARSYGRDYDIHAVVQNGATPIASANISTLHGGNSFLNDQAFPHVDSDGEHSLLGYSEHRSLIDYNYNVCVDELYLIGNSIGLLQARVLLPPRGRAMSARASPWPADAAVHCSATCWADDATRSIAIGSREFGGSMSSQPISAARVGSSWFERGRSCPAPRPARRTRTRAAAWPGS